MGESLEGKTGSGGAAPERGWMFPPSLFWSALEYLHCARYFTFVPDTDLFKIAVIITILKIFGKMGP